MTPNSPEQKEPVAVPFARFIPSLDVLDRLGYIQVESQCFRDIAREFGKFP